jgi:hypothetical protein
MHIGTAKRGLLWVGAALFAGACADCPTLEAGTYTISYREMSGSCGPIDPVTVTLGPGDLPVMGVAPDCTGWLDVAEDGCFAAYDRTCTLEGDVQARFDGFSEPVSSRQARMEFTLDLTTGSDSCRSSYRASVFR